MLARSGPDLAAGAGDGVALQAGLSPCGGRSPRRAPGRRVRARRPPSRCHLRRGQRRARPDVRPPAFVSASISAGASRPEARTARMPTLATSAGSFLPASAFASSAGAVLALQERVEHLGRRPRPSALTASRLDGARRGRVQVERRQGHRRPAAAPSGESPCSASDSERLAGSPGRPARPARRWPPARTRRRRPRRRPAPPAAAAAPRRSTARPAAAAAARTASSSAVEQRHDAASGRPPGRTPALPGRLLQRSRAAPPAAAAASPSARAQVEHQRQLGRAAERGDQRQDARPRCPPAPCPPRTRSTSGLTTPCEPTACRAKISRRALPPKSNLPACTAGSQCGSSSRAVSHRAYSRNSIDRPVQRRAGPARPSAALGDLRQRAHRFEPDLRMLVGDPRGQQRQRVGQPVVPVRDDPHRRRPDAVVAGVQQRRQQLRLDDVERLVGPERFEQVVLVLGVVGVERLRPRPPARAATVRRRAP